MKKIFLINLIMSAMIPGLIAQKKIPVANAKIKDTAKTQLQLAPQYQQAKTNIIVASLIKVFEKPNYQGQSANFVKDKDGKITAPFSLKNVSIKVPEGMLVYIKTCFEFPSENSYSNSIAHINLEQICGIRTDEIAKILVDFYGISTEIHTPDCKRFSGQIDIKVLETSPESATLQSFRPYEIWNRPEYPITIDKYTFTVFHSRQVTNVSNFYVINNNPVPQLTHGLLEDKKNKLHVTAGIWNEFIVGKKALAEGRINLLVKTYLNSAHKSCATCDDFSSHVKMEAPIYETIPINKLYDGGKIIDANHKYPVVGPYNAFGKRDGYAITASSGINKNFRVHLKVDVL
ncbi:MAG: hypothetical protein ABIP30_16435 [Ferruginibacter sp.]